MEFKEAQEKLVYLAHEVSRRNLTWSNMGNVSLRFSQDKILITPTGCFLERLKPEEVVTVNLKGEVIGEGKPSSELPLHVELYKKRKDINWVVHTHSVYLTAFSLLEVSLNYLNPEFEKVLGGVVKVPYRKPHSWELGREVASLIGKSSIALLERHGAVVVGGDEISVLVRAETIEKIAQINFITSVWEKLSRG